MSDQKRNVPTGIALMVSALLVSVALVIGLIAVGNGVSVRGSNTGITITGEASASVSANQVIWTLTAQEIAPTAQQADQHADLARGRPRQHRAKRDDRGERLLGQPRAAFNEFAPEVAEVRDRPAERRQPEP